MPLLWSIVRQMSSDAFDLLFFVRAFEVYEFPSSLVETKSNNSKKSFTIALTCARTNVRYISTTKWVVQVFHLAQDRVP